MQVPACVRGPPPSRSLQRASRSNSYSVPQNDRQEDRHLHGEQHRSKPRQRWHLAAEPQPAGQKARQTEREIGRGHRFLQSVLAALTALRHLDRQRRGATARQPDAERQPDSQTARPTARDRERRMPECHHHHHHHHYDTHGERPTDTHTQMAETDRGTLATDRQRNSGTDRGIEGH
eukprot:COSAG02_NODE_1115_length_14499_cov_46.098958_2_plen_177_part_00